MESENKTFIVSSCSSTRYGTSISDYASDAPERYIVKLLKQEICPYYSQMFADVQLKVYKKEFGVYGVTTEVNGLDKKGQGTYGEVARYKKSFFCYGLMSISDIKLTEAEYSGFIYNNKNEILASKSIKICNDYKLKWGILGLNGKTIIPILYDEIIDLSEKCYGLRAGSTYAIYNMEKKCLVSEYSYEAIQQCREGLIAAKDIYQQKWGLLSKDGKDYSYSFQYESMTYYNKYYLGERISFDNPSQISRELIPSLYRYIKSNIESAEIIEPFQDGKFYLFKYSTYDKSKNLKWGVCDKYGSNSIDSIFDDIYLDQNALVLVKDSKQTIILLDENNHYLHIPRNQEYFDKVKFMNNEYFIFSNGDKSGIRGYNASKSIITFNEICPINEYMYYYRKGSSYGVCTLNEQIVLEEKYQHIESYNNLLIVKYENKYGVYNIQGKEKWPIEYTSIQYVKHEKNIVILEKDGHYYIGDGEGNLLNDSYYTNIGPIVYLDDGTVRINLRQGVKRMAITL